MGMKPGTRPAWDAQVISGPMFTLTLRRTFLTDSFTKFGDKEQKNSYKWNISLHSDLKCNFPKRAVDWDTIPSYVTSFRKVWHMLSGAGFAIVVCHFEYASGCCGFGSRSVWSSLLPFFPGPGLCWHFCEQGSVFTVTQCRVWKFRFFLVSILCSVSCHCER